jgi:hypothetical protein
MIANKVRRDPALRTELSHLTGATAAATTG